MSNKTRLSTFLAVALMFGCAVAPRPTTAQGQRQKDQDFVKNPHRMHQLNELARVEIQIGENKLKTWVMDENSKRMEGMMFLTNKEVQPDDAMIFVFQDEEPLSFWMRNTLIPLDIGYVNAKKQIVTTASMRPLDETGVPSRYAAKYAIEMKAGAFKRLGIKAGMTVKIPDSVKAKD